MGSTHKCNEPCPHKPPQYPRPGRCLRDTRPHAIHLCDHALAYGDEVIDHASQQMGASPTTTATRGPDQ